MHITAPGSLPLAADDRRAFAAAFAPRIGRPRGVPDTETGVRPGGPLQHVVDPPWARDEGFAGSPLLFDAGAVATVSELSDAALKDGGVSGRVPAASASLAENRHRMEGEARPDRAAAPTAARTAPAVNLLAHESPDYSAGYASLRTPPLAAPTGEPVPPGQIAEAANEKELSRREIVARTAEHSKVDAEAIEQAVTAAAARQTDYAGEVHDRNRATEAEREADVRAIHAAAEASAAEVREQLRLESAAPLAAQANVDSYAALALLG